MIVKQRTKPLKIDICEALLRRLPQHHIKRPEIEQQLKNRRAGYKGEQSVDYFLNLLPANEYYIFQGLRLPIGEHAFQIDSLLICKKFILVIESKNFSGTLLFDRDFKQLIRYISDTEEGFADPITQVNRHQFLLKQWLVQHHFPTIPIEGIVSISNSSTIIKTIGGTSYEKVHKKVIHAEHLLETISIFQQQHRKEILQTKSIKKLLKLLSKEHTEGGIKYNHKIPREDFLTGVQCPHCHALPMNRTHAYWICPNCQTKTKDAHLQALQDYFLLISPTITKEEFQRFCHLSSKQTAYRFLSSANLSKSGKTNNKIYFPS